MTKYETYKNSGVEWLGDIPQHWELTRLGTRFLERRVKVSDKDFEPLSVTKKGVFPQLANAAKSNDGDNRKLVKKGDFVINSRSDRKASSGISDRDGSVSLIYIVIEPININGTYCNYLLRGYNFVEEFYRMGHGIVADLWTTRYDDMKSIMVGIPPIQEQTAIANFLDDKTIKIDQAIVIKQKQIELLKERRQILIHKAVTRGLNDDVKLKDSGVEWIGEIPEHWKNTKIKAVAKTTSGATPHSGNLVRYYNGQYPWIRTTDLNNGILNEVPEYITAAALRDTACKMIHKNTICIAMYGGGGTIGKFALVNFDNATLNQAVCGIRGNIEINYLFLYYSLQMMRKHWMFYADGSRKDPNISQDIIKNMPIVYPHLAEQKRIVEYIEISNTKIATAISLKEQEIDKLKEYKMSLIDGIVTGKVRVC